MIGVVLALIWFVLAGTFILISVLVLLCGSDMDKMANDLGFSLYTDYGRVYLTKESNRIMKHGFAKTYDYLYNIKKKQVV